MRRAVPFLLAIVVIGCDRSPTAPFFPFGSCPSPSFSLAPAGTIGATVDSLAANEMRTQHLPAMTIALAKQGTIIYAQGYGYADLSNCLPTQSTTPFQLGSVTKQFTAAAILQLQSTGALDIDEPIITYLPSYPFDPRITLRMLLNMVSGLADYVNDTTTFPQNYTWELNGATEHTILTAIAHAPLQFTPGSEYQYSNSNYFILGVIIEVVSGESYANYLAAKIIGPLALAHTSLTPPPAAALPYSLNGQEVPIMDPSSSFAAGGLWSNVLDLANWDAALLAGRALPATQFTEMVTPATSSGYAMGWVYGTFFSRPFAFHTGGIITCTGGGPGAFDPVSITANCGGPNSFNGFFLDDGFSISVLTNARPTSETLGANGLPFVAGIYRALCFQTNC